MPAAITPAQRSAIVRRASLGYSQAAIAEAVGVSRNTVRKYLHETRAVVEAADDPAATLAAIVREEYDWERAGPVPSFGDHPM